MGAAMARMERRQRGCNKQLNNVLRRVTVMRHCVKACTIWVAVQYDPNKSGKIVVTGRGYRTICQ